MSMLVCKGVSKLMRIELLFDYLVGVLVHLGTPRGAQVNLAPRKRILNVNCSNLHIDSQHASNWGKQPIPTQKSSVLKDNSTMWGEG